MSFDRFEFRYIRQEEAAEAAEIEKICFPPSQACAEEQMFARIKEAPDFFLVAADTENGKLAGFLNGIVTDENAFRDAFFTETGIHDPDGKNVMLAGLDVRPEYRGKGLAGELVRQYRDREKERGRKRLVLTCLEEKIGMYEKFGFRDLGESASTWGGVKWHEMEMLLD